MAIKMTHAARAELTYVVRERYRAAAGADKSKILDEFITVTGYHHKSAIRELNSEPTSKKLQTRARPPLLRRGGSGCARRSLGGIRQGMREAAEGPAADSIAGLGAQWAFASPRADTPKERVHERCDNRPITASAT